MKNPFGFPPVLCASFVMVFALCSGCSKSNQPADNEIAKPEPRVESTPIHNAVRAGDADKVLELLKADPNAINSKDGAGMTPLHVAASVGNAKIVELLLENKADINATDAKRYTPFNLAFNAGHKDVIALLWKAGGGAQNDDGSAPASSPAPATTKPDGGTIFEAARDGDLEHAKSLLKSNPQLVSSKDDKGRTPLFLAIIGQKKEIIELLITNGADVNAAAPNGFTALHVASLKGYTEGGKLLLEKKANPDARGGQNRSTALHTAAINGFPEFIQMLLAHGADPNPRDAQGNTPLVYAVGGDEERTGVVEALLKGKANPNVSLGQNVSLVQVASQKGYQRTIQLLRRYGGR